MVNLLQPDFSDRRIKISFLILIVLTIHPVKSFPQNHDAELTSQDTRITVKNGKLYKSVSQEIRILNRAGENFTRVQIPYSRLVRISKLEAYIKDKDGIIIKKLEKNEISDKNLITEGSFYQDNFVREFTLRHNSYPYTIFCSYQIQEEQFFRIDYWIPVISRRIPTVRATMSLEVPRDYKISFNSQLTDSFRTDTSGLSINYYWEASYHDLIDDEINCPDYLQFLPRVIIVPDKFTYDKPGSFLTWKALGDWNSDLSEGLSDLEADTKQNIRNLVEGIADKRQKIKKLYNYMQDHTRYINVSIETGGLKPYPASYVEENKYGDCKALANYFKAVLEAAGIKAYYTLVNAGDPKIRIDKSFPFQQFNHIILFVPLDQDTLWLDCTSDLSFNYTGTFTQDRDVFVIEKNNSHFLRTPPLPVKDVTSIRRVNVRQNLQNQFIATFSNTYRGEDYEALYYLSHSVEMDRRSQIFARGYLETGYELIDLRITERDRDEPEITADYSTVATRHFKSYGNDLIVDILPFELPAFEAPGRRKLPVQIDFPVSKTDTLEYEIPAEYRIINKTDDRKIDSEFGLYEIKSTILNNNVEIVKSLVIFKGEYPLEKYNDFFTFISRVSEAEKNNKIIANKKM